MMKMKKEEKEKQLFSENFLGFGIINNSRREHSTANSISWRRRLLVISAAACTVVCELKSDLSS
jgi:hypothetical protein